MSEKMTAQQMCMSQCCDCEFRESIHGDHHTRCTFKWGSTDDQPPSGNPHGINSGWFFFPHNFDPTWMTSICTARKGPSLATQEGA